MEAISSLIAYGARVKSIRKELKKNQVDFYRSLYPEVINGDENIKSTMRKIEQGKTKYLNVDFLLRLCSMYGVSADYLLGLTQDYANHENEFICKYTGLDEPAVEQLHKWNVAKNNGADLSKIEEAFWEAEEESHIKMYQKQEGISMLRIVNYLFKSGKRRKRPKGQIVPYSNISILHSLYLMSMAEPERVKAYPQIDQYVDYFLQRINNRDFTQKIECVTLDLTKPIIMVDNNKTYYVIDPKDTLEQIGKTNLEKGVSWLIEQVKLDKKNNYNIGDNT